MGVKNTNFLPMGRSDIINHLAKKISAKSYLEIGVRLHSENFDRINIDYKVGVDPCVEFFDREPTYKLTSDDFFAQNTETFDIIFVDGLHEFKQVKRDINNSLKFLNDGGFIVCHDMNPVIYERQLLKEDPKRHEYSLREKEKGNPEYGLWNGDCWKAFVKIRNERNDLTMCTVDTDFGCGIISFGRQELLDFKEEDINYQNLDKKRKEWLNLISVGEFLNLFTL